MHENEQIINYINRIRQLASTLKSMGVEIDDKERAMAVAQRTAGTLRQFYLCIGCSWE